MKTGRVDNPLINLLRPSSTASEAKQRLEKALAIHELEHHTALNHWFMLETSVATKTLKIASIIGSNFKLEVNDQNYHYLLIGHGGHLIVEADSNICLLQSRKAVLLPRSSWRLSSEESSSFTSIGFMPLDLITAARTLAPPAWTPPLGQDTPLGSLLKKPAQGDQACTELINAAISIIAALAELTRLDEELLNSAGLAQDLYKVMALIAFDDLRNSEFGGYRVEIDKVDRRLYLILDFIRLNLDKKISISLLHAQSTYSRRSLEYAFKEQIGCTPLQWIRRERMALALAKLKTSDPTNTTVKDIASSCGYKSLSRFYIDFNSTYGCTPHDILRLTDEGT
jgi:AraC-like DNA-binding protein